MANNDHDWLQNLVRASVYRSSDQQDNSLRAGSDTQQAQEYPKPKGLGSPFHALKTITNKSQLAGAKSNPRDESAVEHEMATILHRQRVTGNGNIQSRPSPAHQSAVKSTQQISQPVSAYGSWRSQTVPGSACRSQAQSISLDHQRASQPVPVRAYHSVSHLDSKGSHQSTSVPATELSVRTNYVVPDQIPVYHAPRPPSWLTHQPTIQSSPGPCYQSAPHVHSRLASQQTNNLTRPLPSCSAPIQSYTDFIPGRSAPTTTVSSSLEKPAKIYPLLGAPGKHLLPPLDRHHEAKKRRVEDRSTKAASESLTPELIESRNLLTNKSSALLLTSLKCQPNIIQPLNDTSAVAKITYDPNTIARDVLIATGHHPTEPGLNYHLRDLQSLFSAVSASANLETFRWDMVEEYARASIVESQNSQLQAPVSRSLPASRLSHQVQLPSIVKQSTGEQPSQQAATPLERYKPSNILRKTPQLAVSENGSSVPIKPLESNITKLPQAASSSSKQVFATSQQRKSPATRLPKTSSPSQPRAVDLVGKSPTLSLPHGLLSINHLGRSLELDFQKPPSVVSLPGDKLATNKPAANLSNYLPATSHRKGSPAARHQEYSLAINSSSSLSVADPREQSHPTSFQKQSPITNLPGRSSAASMSGWDLATKLSSQSPPFSPHKQSLDEDMPKQMPTEHLPNREHTVIQVEVPAPQGRVARLMSEPKARNGKQLQHMLAQRRAEAQTPYPVFACKWANCRAELHNLAVLTQHILKVHVPFHVHCAWVGCTSRETLAAAKLLDHIKTQHIEPIAWKLGNGPSVSAPVGSEVNMNPRPLVRPDSGQVGEEDSLILPASYSSIRAFNRVHKKCSPQEKAAEILKAVQRLKERIGVGLDSGGCELATPARNKRVSSDEEVYELVARS